MKKKQINKKLSLNKVTVAGLNDNSMNIAKGGADPMDTDMNYGNCYLDVTLGCTYFYNCFPTAQVTCKETCGKVCFLDPVYQVGPADEISPA